MTYGALKIVKQLREEDRHDVLQGCDYLNSKSFTLKSDPLANMLGPSAGHARHFSGFGGGGGSSKSLGGWGLCCKRAAQNTKKEKPPLYTSEGTAIGSTMTSYRSETDEGSDLDAIKAHGALYAEVEIGEPSKSDEFQLADKGLRSSAEGEAPYDDRLASPKAYSNAMCWRFLCLSVPKDPNYQDSSSESSISEEEMLQEKQVYGEMRKKHDSSEKHKAKKIAKKVKSAKDKEDKAERQKERGRGRSDDGTHTHRSQRKDRSKRTGTTSRGVTQKKAPPLKKNLVTEPFHASNFAAPEVREEQWGASHKEYLELFKTGTPNQENTSV